MKQPGKKLSALLALMLILSVLSGAAFAEESDTDITVAGLSFTVPEGMFVFTHGMAEDDPALEELGVTSADIDGILGEYITMILVPEDASWEMQIWENPLGEGLFLTEDIGNLSDMSESELEAFVEEQNELDPDNPIEIVWMDGYPFLGGTLVEEDEFTIFFFTSREDQEIVLVFYGYDLEALEEQMVIWSAILDDIQIGDVTESEESEEETAEEAEEEPEEEPFVWDTEGSTVYEIPDAGLNIEIPNSYFTMTRGMTEDDPVLLGLGLDPETVDELLESFNRQLNVVPNDLSWEFSLTAVTDEEFEEVGDMALYSAEDFEESFEEMDDEFMNAVADDTSLSDGKLQILDSGTVVLGGYNYYWLDASLDVEGATYSRESVYVTLFGGTEYVFTLAYTDDLQTEDVALVAEALLSNVEFTAEPTGITAPPGFLDSLSDGLVSGVITGAVTGAVVALVGVLIGRAQRKNKQKKTAARAKAEVRPDPWESDWSDKTPWKDEQPTWRDEPERQSESKHSEYGYSTPDDNRNDPPYMN